MYVCVARRARADPPGDRGDVQAVAPRRRQARPRGFGARGRAARDAVLETPGRAPIAGGLRGKYVVCAKGSDAGDGVRKGFVAGALLANHVLALCLFGECVAEESDDPTPDTSWSYSGCRRLRREPPTAPLNSSVPS